MQKPVDEKCSAAIQMQLDVRREKLEEIALAGSTWKKVGRISEACLTIMVMTCRPEVNFAFKGFGGGCLPRAVASF